MVPQIIYIILQVLSTMVTFTAYSKKKQWKELKWFIIGLLVTNILLYWGGFYNPLMQ